MAASFANLPTELLEKIIRYTTRTDLPNIRRVSKQLELVARAELFVNHAIVSTTKSVRKLEKVLASRRLRICVKHLKLIRLAPRSKYNVGKCLWIFEHDGSIPDSHRTGVLPTISCQNACSVTQFLAVVA